MHKHSGSSKSWVGKVVKGCQAQVRQTWLALLLLAVLLAQTSALMHKVAHHVLEPSAHRVEASQEAVNGLADLTPASNGLLKLWADHTHRSDCQLLDQLAHATPPAQVVLIAATAVPIGRNLLLRQAPRHFFHRFYRAQAPPVFI